jgi:hypothetical protein
MPEKNNFRFFIPIDSFKKAKDATGKTVMKMAGIASTKRRDTDGEVLHPNGFDISYLKEKGIVNWNHDRSPDAIIGEPAVAEIRKEGLFIESLLYPESKKAKQVYNLAEVLKKSNAKRRLGYSVEGKAIERDPTDPSQVTKAMITNVAITISPKNPDSSIDIVKGGYQEWADDEKPPVLETTPIDDLLKGINTTEDALIVDVTRPDGKRVVIDGNYNVKISKGAKTSEEEEESEDEEKALTTTSGAAVIPEHVDGTPKELQNGAPQKTSMNKGENTNFLTEEEVLCRIMKSNSVITFSQANEILKTLNDLTMQKNGKTTEISEDLLEKSLAKLGFSKTKKNLSKAEKEEAGEEEEDDDETEVNEQEEGKTPGKNKKGMKKANTISKKYKNEEEDDDEEDPEEEDRDEEHNEREAADGSAKKRKGMKKSVRTTIVKAEPLYDTEFMDQLAEGMSEVKDMVQSVGIIVKGCYDIIKGQQDEIAELCGQLEAFGNAPAGGGRKSIVTKAVNRNFEKGMGGEDTLEKSEDGRVKVDVRRARQQVLNMFDVMTFQKGNGVNQEMANAMRLFEASGIIHAPIQKAIENEFKVALYKSAE